MNAQGATVPDGYYNIQFKIYQDGDGQTVETTGIPVGTPAWTESWLNVNGKGVMVKNGFLSVELGSITPFSGNVNFNQDTLWLSINIADTNVSCTPFSNCNPDGEMLPMKRLSASPYSLNSGLLNGLSSANFVQLAQGVQTDASTNTNSIFINKTGTGNFLSLQSNGNDAFNINNSGDIVFGVNSDHTISVETANPDSAGLSLSLSAGNGGTGAAALKGGDLLLQGGNAGGTNGNGGDLVLDAGQKIGTGNDGIIQIGTSYASTIQIGNPTIATGTQTINIGNANTAGGSTNITIGTGYTASAGTTTIQSKNDLSLTSNSGNIQITADNGAIDINSNGNTTINSDSGTIAITSAGNTTIGTNSATRATFTTSNNLYLGNGVTGALNPFTVTSTSGNAGIAGSDLTVGAGNGGSNSAGGSLNLLGGSGGSTSGSGGSIAIQGGNATAGNSNGGDVAFNAGLKQGSGIDGNISIGNLNSNTIQIGNLAPVSTQTINIGGNTTSGTTNITIGSSNSSASGATNIQAKDSVSINTNGISRAIFDNAGNIYFGNGVTAGAPSNFTIRGTNSSTTAVAGSTISVQGGNATVGNANGGNLVLSGGTGIGSGSNGLVVISTPTFSTTINDANCYTGGALVSSSCTISAASINNSSAVIVGFSTLGQTSILPDPSINTAGRVIYITAANGSNDFSLSVNGGGTGNTIAMRQNTTATMIWNGNDWTAAGASSSTTLQSAYDNTLQSAGGAELIVSKTSTTNGLTIRDSSTAPVNGTLLSVQTSSSAGLFSVNSNVTEYSSNSGAEVYGANSNTFPTNTWSSTTGATVSRYTTVGDFIATGQASVSTSTSTSANSGVANRLTTTLTANTNYNVSFSSRLSSGTFTDMNVYYSVDGSASSSLCTTDKAINTSVWTKVNCTFTTPTSGITTNNAILILQTNSGTARTFYIDNLSVTISADFNYATDGSVNDDTNFATNWSFVNASTGSGSVSRNTSDGYDASDSAGVTITTGATNAGIRNRLSVNPLTDTLYRISIYAKLASGSFTNFKVRYSPIGSTGSTGTYVDCVDYNTQTINTTGWTKVSCYLKTGSTTVTNPYVYFVEGSAVARTYYVDALSMTLADETVPNVQIGGGVNGGPVTLFTLDRSASAPIASDNDALLGSMYYDTSLGKLQCYEADGWGACGSSPDNVVTISPEFTNAVLHGTGVGTMISDLCSDTLNINNGALGQPTICGPNETYNLYKWTSPQASPQTYSIYVTYQLPSTFKEFASGQTSLMARTDSVNSNVQYQIYRNDASTGLTACGPSITVSSGVQTSWQTEPASGAADPSTCGFAAGNSILFRISMTASQNANAYVGNLNFIFSNR